ncbi:MAG: hypothetical protein QW292_12615 [Candidatus Parvarchaeota archaeon]
MVEETEMNDANVEKKAEYKEIRRRKGRFGEEISVVVPHIPQIPGESVTQSLGRYILDTILTYSIHWKMLLVLALGASLYVLYKLFGILAFEAIILIIIASFISAEIIANWHLKQHIVQIRETKFQDDIKVVNVEAVDQKITLKVLESKIAPGEDSYREWETVDAALDPENPNALRLLGCNILNTGYGKYIFARSVDPENKLVIGESQDYPGIALLPMLIKPETLIPKALREIDKAVKKGNLKPEEAEELKKRGMKIAEDYIDYLTTIKEHGGHVYVPKEMTSRARSYIVGLDQVGSRFFKQYAQWKDQADIPQELRNSRIMNLLNSNRESVAVISFLLTNMARMTEEAWSKALGTIQNIQGMTEESINARYVETMNDIETLISKPEKEIIKKSTGEEI